LAPIESAYATSYLSVVVTCCMHCFRDIAGFVVITRPLFSLILGVFPLDQIGYVGVNPRRHLIEIIFELFRTCVITVPERYRQTDRRTDDILWHKSLQYSSSSWE